MSADDQREQRAVLDLDALERSHESTRLGWLDASQKYGFIQATLDALPDLIAAARERDRLLASKLVTDEQLRKQAELFDTVRKIAAEWAEQPTDYDEDTEQQIADGRTLRGLLGDQP